VAEARERDLQNYVTPEGRTPFEDWISKLRDQRAKARIFVRIDRVRLGNFGDCRSAGGLLCGGDKSTQSRDLEDARRYWKEFKSDVHEELR
jgi:putative component of toxin-antitoxin plasmid stabilization module